MQKKIGFIGLGQMGRWMATNLAVKGFDLTVFDVDDKAVEKLAEKGAKPSKSPADLAKQVDCIFLSLPNSQVVETVVFKDNGIVTASKPGQILIDCGTSNFLWTQEFHQRLLKHNIRFADVPVTGMEQRAKEATLAFMFGGEKELLEEIRPALEAMGTEVQYMGDIGTGQLSKTINNILLNIHLAALAEVVPMAVKMGLDPKRIVDVINNGSGKSFASSVFLPWIL
ncbi:MAG: NAD(P)-dependent oxidoreductase, partial [Desulfobacteraceae bacterium]